MVVEEVPLAVVLDNGVVVGPALVWRLGHDYALELIRAKGLVTHGVGQCFRLVLHPWVGEVELSVFLKDEGAFLETGGEGFVQADGFSREFGKIVLDQGALEAESGPEEVGVSVRCLEHAGVYAEDAGDGVFIWRIWAVGGVCNGHAYVESAAILGSVGKYEVVLAVLLHAVRGPHGIAVRLAPRHVFLSEDYAVVRPVNEVFRREGVVILHTEPFPFRFHGTYDVVGWVEPDLAAKDAGGRVCAVLVPDYWILGLEACREQEGRYGNDASHSL